MSFIGIFILALFIPASQSQNSPEDFLAPHNAARDDVNFGPLEWDETVAAYACDYANQRAGDCSMIHSSGPYGENLSMSTGDLSAADAVKMWVDEISNYDYYSNSCQGGENSVRLGCARVTCSTGGTFVICSYDPLGNVIGQRPYNYDVILSNTGSIYNI
ncbi:hypothetical protein MKX03_010669 [Papaver bracteatum]|nr:hypothetical protein MKX03_010669 [Papaver bracteatum]